MLFTSVVAVPPTIPASANFQSLSVVKSNVLNVVGVDLSIFANTGPTDNSTGGNISINTGTGSGTGSGGSLSAVCGNSGTGVTGDGGNVVLSAGTALSTNGTGGGADFNSGVGSGTGSGGATSISSGRGGATSGDGGVISLVAGNGGGTGNGGSVDIVTGSGTADGAYNLYIGGFSTGAVKYIWPTVAPTAGQRLQATTVSGTNPVVVTMTWDA